MVSNTVKKYYEHPTKYNYKQLRHFWLEMGFNPIANVHVINSALWRQLSVEPIPTFDCIKNEADLIQSRMKLTIVLNTIR